MRFRQNYFFLAGTIAALSLTSATATADPAMVINSGRDGTECAGQLDPPLNGYAGHASVVSTKSGEVMVRCHADILGDPPIETLVLYDFVGPLGTTCTVILTKGGKLNATCHD
jgi:hypothetical protein